MSNRLYVTNISFEASAFDLGRLFESIGPVVNASIAYNDGKSLGYGFVILADEYTAQSACERFNNIELFGRPIKVSIARVNNERGASNFFQGNRFGNYGGDGGWYDDDQRERERDNFSGGYGYSRGGYGDYNRRGGYGGDGYRGALRGGRGGFHPRVINENTPRSKTQIHVKNLEYSSTVEELRNAFDGFDIREVLIPNDSLGHSYGFGLVDFTTHDEQLRALARGSFTLHGREVVLSVAFVRYPPRTVRSSAASSTTAGAAAATAATSAGTATSGAELVTGTDTDTRVDADTERNTGAGTDVQTGAQADADAHASANTHTPAGSESRDADSSTDLTHTGTSTDTGISASTGVGSGADITAEVDTGADTGADTAGTLTDARGDASFGGTDTHTDTDSRAAAAATAAAADTPPSSTSQEQQPAPAPESAETAE